MSMGWFESLSDVLVLATVASCPVTRRLDIYHLYNSLPWRGLSVRFEAGG